MGNIRTIPDLIQVRQWIEPRFQALFFPSCTHPLTGWTSSIQHNSGYFAKITVNSILIRGKIKHGGKDLFWISLHFMGYHISSAIIIYQMRVTVIQSQLYYMSYVSRLRVNPFGSMDVGCKLTQGLVDLTDEAKIMVEASIPGQWGNGAMVFFKHSQKMSTVINWLFGRASNMPRKDIPGRKSQNQLKSDVFSPYPSLIPND